MFITVKATKNESGMEKATIKACLKPKKINRVMTTRIIVSIKLLKTSSNCLEINSEVSKIDATLNCPL